MAKSNVSACPCGVALDYARCCKPLHDGEPATGALALMRSRYTAYVMDNTDYLLSTWHSLTRPAELASGSHAAQRWLGLKIVQDQRLGDDEWEVEFVARYRRLNGQAVRLHEVSRFQHVDGRWFYVDGVQR